MIMDFQNNNHNNCLNYNPNVAQSPDYQRTTIADTNKTTTTTTEDRNEKNNTIMEATPHMHSNGDSTEMPSQGRCPAKEETR
jgi:hypothetical protein